ncbi:helix-turn-helix domain-containing protein [Actinomadura formosensis]|uniref:helix-turn-helix domain-containing protein n=1 Tax=Actinomadura formosensis TaxID=60706 RepID=UPI003D8C0CBF
MDDRELGRRIGYWRRRRGFTQVIFADLIGRSKSWVVKVEGGYRSAARLDILDDICQVLRVDLSTLIGEEPSRQAQVCLDDADTERIQSALENYSVAGVTEDRPYGIDALRGRVRYAWTAFEYADYTTVSLTLPDLIMAGRKTFQASQDVLAREMLIEIYQIASSTLRKLGEPSLAWLAGDRGMALSQNLETPALSVATGFRVANALLSLGRARQAKELAVSLAERIQAESRDESNRALYGHVMLQAAVAAATADDEDRASVQDLIGEARDAARHVTTQHDHYHLEFGKTNVSLHEVTILLAQGEGGRAVQAANSIDEFELRKLRKERRAALRVDVARAYNQIGERDQALRNLIEAERIAPREVRCRPVAQAAISDLMRRARGAPSFTLEQLAARAGVKN